MADIYQIKLLDNTTYDIKDANVPHSSLPAASGGADLSLVTTGEKYTWNNKSATEISYSNTTSGISATDIQEAIDEVVDDITYVKSASDSIVTFNDSIGGMNLIEVKCDINAIQSGSGTPSPDNPRPITGFNGATIVRCGKNLIDQSLFVQGGLDGAGNETMTNYDYRVRTGFISFPNGTYKLTTGSTGIRIDTINFYNGTTFISRVIPNASNYTLTKSVGDNIRIVLKRYPENNIVPSDVTTFQCELGQTASTFEAYNGNTYNIPFGQTVYGGVLDVTTGKLTVTHGFVTLDNTTNFSSTGNAAFLNVTNDYKIVEDYGIGLCNMFNFDTWNNVTSLTDGLKFTIYKHPSWSVPRLAFNLGTQTLADFKASLENNPIQVCYELATPTEITLTPKQIETLANQVNNVFHDCNGQTEVKYISNSAEQIVEIAESQSVASTIAEDLTYSNLTTTNKKLVGAINEVVEDKADRVPLPADYDATSTYAVGDFCTYNGDAYVCVTTISTPEAWDSSHWILDSQQDYLHSINPSGIGSFSLNRRNGTTVGILSFAAGRNGTASGKYSHAEGDGANATGMSSHAEGISTTASREGAHAEGAGTKASNVDAHAEGWKTTASGVASHAEGSWTIATGDHSHAEGYYTTAKFAYQHVFGEYNVIDPASTYSNYRGNYVEIVGNGTADDARSNARTLDWSGNEVLSGSLTSDSVTTNAITATTLNGVTIGAAPAFTDTTYGLSTSGNDVILSANGTAQDTITVPYATNSGTVNSLTVETAVPASAVFTDTTYTLGTSGNDVTLTPSSGTAQSITVPYATSAGSATKATQDGDGNTISSTYVKVTGDPTIYKNSDMPQGAANLSATATTHRTTIYRNGLSIPYQMDNPNDGGILRVRGTSENNCILELGTWDDSGSGETIQFNYYPTTSQVTPTYSVSVPKASGTIALTSQAISNITRSGTTFTATRANGTTFTFTQQDNNNQVTQNASTSNNNNYELLISGTADNTTRTEGVLKSSRFRSNPSNGQTYWRDANRTRVYAEPNSGKAEGYNNSGGINWSLRGDTGQIVCVYVTQGSSRKIKDNIKPIEDSDKVLQLQAVSFDYKDKNRGTDKRGFIAEDVAKVLPNVTTPETFDTPMGINYTELIPYLQDVIKKQEARISALEEQIQSLLNEKESNK